MAFKLANKFKKGSATLAAVTADTFDGATDVDPVTDEITLTAHAFVANQPVRLTEGANTTPVGLFNDNVYFILVVDVNTVQLSKRPGGSAINITADGVGTITLTPVEAIEFPSAAQKLAFMVDGTSMLVRFCYHFDANKQIWQDWTAGSVSTPTDAALVTGFNVVSIEGVGDYSYIFN